VLTDFLQAYNQNKKAYCRLVDADKSCVIWHDGRPTESGTAVTAATIEATADTSITLKVNGAVDSRIGTAGVLAVATYDNYLKLANNINAAQGWHCQLVDARGADATSNFAAITAVSCYKTTGTAVIRDQSDILTFSVGLVDYGYGTESITAGGKHCINNKRQPFLEYFYSDLVFNDGTYLLKVYDCDDNAGTDELIYEADGAATTVLLGFPTNGPTGFPIMSARPGHRLLVFTLCSDATNPDALSRVGLIGSIVSVM
jgi:hypothetical protein